MKTLFTFTLILFFSGIQAQVKTAYYNKQAILKLMPENEKIKQTLAKYKQQTDDELSAMKARFELAKNSLEKERNELSPAVIISRESDLSDMEKRIALFESESKENLKKTESLLYEAVHKKIDDTARSIAKKNGYSEIKDISSEQPANYSSEHDITQLVKTKLKI